MKNLLIILISVFALTSCATIVNDPNVPVALSFSDGSSGTCNLTIKEALGVVRCLELLVSEDLMIF